MFLFKLTLPLLGSVTLGAVGTGIYYGIKQGKQDAELKDKNKVENGAEANEQTGTRGETNAQTQEAGPKKPIPPKEASPSLSPDSSTEEVTTSPNADQFDEPTVNFGFESTLE